MRKTMHRNDNGKYQKIPQFASSHNIGLATARKIAEKSGAIRRIGRLVLVDVDICDDYIDSQCKEG